ncbi:Xaa-Pro aminopeptidase [Terriglobus roseus DSM 18391]|uniref:Xaa-Pro aminopeptidase n=1 Tax=Terriglobus roseus (strain DSM 18391 / NRRL B-41598 / KBS 63) TaxID=926566 RepID=I3ZKE9_TERRK|nr:M24 family metallopeptidase [Terriglobus roseus]AFL89717.1 Xaa-Pro aminopeptidase [Terriglobus roseus DSM 18391]
MDLARVQQALRDAKLDGWLFYDHHVRDPLAYRILGLDPGMHVTRRWFYFIPATGEPRKLNHRIESGKLDKLPGERTLYSTWQEMEQSLEKLLQGATTIAMQYSPRNAVMYVAMVDAGTIEVLQGMGKTIVSSANLVSQFEAVLTDRQIETHYVAQKKIDRILEDAWREIGARARGDHGVTEFDMVEWLQAEIAKEGLITEHGPNVSVGANAADSHYEPLAGKSSRIERGSFLLIDIWGKLKDDPEAVWYDITWTGVIDRDATELEGRVFKAVTDARDAAIRLVQDRFAANQAVAGWEPDAAAREVIMRNGFGEWFTHRTGHNIGTELHGAGAHLDNFETHDERLILPNTCFSVEPGIYLPPGPECFGVRSEIDMITRPGSAVVTGKIQRELVRL